MYICTGIFEKQAKITKSEEELAKRMSATASAPVPLPPAPVLVPPAPLVTNLLAILDVLKQDLDHSDEAHEFLSEPIKAIGKELGESFESFEKFLGLACRWQAAVSQ